MPGLYGEQACFDVVDVGGEIGDQLGPVVETDDEEFILRLAVRRNSRIEFRARLILSVILPLRSKDDADRKPAASSAEKLFSFCSALFS